MAKSHGISEKTVREEIKKAITDAITSSNSSVQFLWKQIPCNGDTPEPEELIEWFVKHL